MSSVKAIIETCHEASESDRMTFPQILEKLAAVGIEGYTVDYRRSTKTYYQADGESLELTFPKVEAVVAPDFDARLVQGAILEAQAQAPGYTYRGFSCKVMEAGCAGYITSILGHRVVYFGRTAETHLEVFPGAA